MRTFLLVLWGIMLAAFLHAQTTHASFDSIWGQNIMLSEKISQVDSLVRSIDPYNNNLPLNQIFKALHAAEKADNTMWVPRLYLTVGGIYSTIDIQDSAKIYLESALKMLQENKDRLYIPRAYRELSWLYTYVPEYDKALELAYLSLEGYEAIGNEEQVAVLKSRIAQIWEYTGQPEKTLPLLLEAEKTLSQYDNYRSLAYTYLRLAQYYRSIDDSVNAQNNFDRYIETMKKMPDGGKYFLISAYCRRGNYFRELKQYTAAEKDLQLALNIARENKDTLQGLIATYSLGCLYAEVEQYEKAIQLLEEVILVIEENLNKNEYFFLGVDFQEMYGAIEQAYAKSGQYEKAYTFLSQHKKITDSLFNIETNRTMLDMRTKYETEKKETLLQQKQQELYLALGGVGIAALVAMLLWWGYSNKKRHNTLLEKRNEEKEFLIKEIHHRVKNNLQVLSSLLGLQSDYIEDKAALAAVNESRSRVQSMGLIHQKLYMSENLAAIEMKDFVRDLNEYLLSTFGVEDQVNIDTDIQVAPMDVDSAIPLGLIINELLTNSLKYAFPEGQKGRIKIKMWIAPEKDLCLSISDNGVGKTKEVNVMHSTNFGSDLIKTLSKKLKGSIHVNTENGYSTLIRFQRYKLGSLG